MEKFKYVVKPVVYCIGILLVLANLFFLIQANPVKGFTSDTKTLKNFMTSFENKTFDLRQNILYKHKKHNENIVILAIDDVSYELISSEYGSWPAPRAYWANMINELQQYHPKAIVFDMLFVNNPAVDQKKITQAINSNPNVFVAIDFDDYSQDARTAPTFPDAIKMKLQNAKLLKTAPQLQFSNSRGLVPEILNSTKNIGSIRIARDNDGVIRNYMPFIVYKDEFYPNLSLLTALYILGVESRDFTMERGAIKFDDTRKIPFSKNGTVTLNWYGPSETFKHIPLYEMNKAIKQHNSKYIKENVEGKIVYIGASAIALGDIKTTPMSSVYPGVEIQATFLNNILDNNLIKRFGFVPNALVSLFLALLVVGVIFKSPSTLFANITTLLLLVVYFDLSVAMMHFFNYWVGLVMPITTVIITFVICYVLKYVFKSRDFEETYKLAVTDALTNMFNHRYFQEQMIINCNTAARYETPFSLILIDIDFFKKFNDTYGHQSGDAVLKQVANTIKKSVRATDIACRYGGEEMSVILTNTNKEEAIKTAEKICLAVRNTEFVLVGGQKTNVTISLGVSTAPFDGKTPPELIEHADKCLYKAKENGRNQVVHEI